MDIVIIDYGMGNLRNVQKAFEHIGVPATVSAQTSALDRAHGLVLPGVGAFGDAMSNLSAGGLIKPILRNVKGGKPLLGICLGLQLLFEESTELGRHEGLGLMAGRVTRFDDTLKVPHIGWNQLDIRQAGSQSPLLKGIPNHSYAYFVHSFYVEPDSAGCILSTTEYGVHFASVVGHGNVFGVQPHPEKSQEVGLALLGNFASIVREQHT